MTWNYNMAEAPQDRPILGLCKDQCAADNCGFHTGAGTSLCLYHAHAEGLSKVSDGPHVLEWGGSWDDSTHEYNGGYMPDWWFRFDSEFEVAANPIAWTEIPVTNECRLEACRKAEPFRVGGCDAIGCGVE